jgi:hypothetical protein
LTTIIVALRTAFAFSVQAAINAITFVIEAPVYSITAAVESLFNTITTIINPVCDDIGFVSHDSAGDQQYSGKDQAAFYCVHYVPCVHVSTP